MQYLEVVVSAGIIGTVEPLKNAARVAKAGVGRINWFKIIPGKGAAGVGR